MWNNLYLRPVGGRISKINYEFFYGDFDKAELEARAADTSAALQISYRKRSTNSRQHKKVLLTLSNVQRMLINAFCRSFQLLIVLSATNTTSERPFSALRCIKSYLRSTMTQARLNHLMILHYHQDLCLSNK